MGTAPMSVPPSAHELAPFSARWSVQFAEIRADNNDTDAQALREQDQSVRRIESLLSSARTALGALRSTEADTALEEAAKLIRDHAELPQAGWLLAEHHVILAERIDEEDPERARELLAAAAALEGERVQAFRDSQTASPRVALPGRETVQLSGLSPRDQLEWDGEIASLPLLTRRGEHHARVVRRGRSVWAGWVSVGGQPLAAQLPLAAPAPCSADDLDGSVDGEPGPRAHAATQCTEWAIARVSDGDLRLARCQGARCGPWQSGSLSHSAQPQAVSERRFPRWLTYAALGAGAALVTGFVLVQTGAFSNDDPARERWVYSGLRP
ncbi:MAG: hypothetical protein QM756_21960 [Polyangiaceae bacterium]